MIKTDNEEFECLICYDTLGMDNCVTVDDCNHSFCYSCMNEDIFQYTLECPVDRKTITMVKYKNVVQTYRDYQLQVLISEKTQILKQFEDYWFSPHTIVTEIKLLVEVFRGILAVLDPILNSTSDIDEIVIKKFSHDISEITKPLEDTTDSTDVEKPRKLKLIYDTMLLNNHRNEFAKNLLIFTDSFSRELRGLHNDFVHQSIYFQMNSLNDKSYLEKLKTYYQNRIEYYCESLKDFENYITNMKIGIHNL